MNLITDLWIPVRLKNGEQRIVRPHEIADDAIAAPDWPRADLNVACLELLIGLVFMADPPADEDDWEARQKPDPKRLEQKFVAYNDAFNLSGDGPRFMQDLEKLEGDENPPDMLFIDSAGANTAKNNADLMVRRDRYETLPPELAAMALFAFQTYAPSGGAGNRTSMRGGGPMTTLVDPAQGLWALVWANVPYGKAAKASDVPWMRPTKVSDEKKPPTYPDDANSVSVETLFGMPRRLRLVFDDAGNVCGAIQRPYGTNYLGWVHPFSPYYRQKAGSELLPVHPKPGVFSYRNWLGVVLSSNESSLRQRAACVERWQNHHWKSARILVAGWAMDNMKPLDFVYSSQPIWKLNEAQSSVLIAFISAAELFAGALRQALKPVAAEGERLDSLREQFFTETQASFEDCAARIHAGEDSGNVAARWRDEMRRTALRIFHDASVPGLGERPPQEIEKIVQASKLLNGTLAGYGKFGAQAYGELNLEPLGKSTDKEAA